MEILRRKKTIIKNGEEIVDFSEPTFVPNELNPNYEITRVISLTDDYIMRPDLVSNVVYNNTYDMDKLLKINEISDPLSLKESDGLIVIDKRSLDSFYVTPEEEQTTQQTFLDKNKGVKKDNTRLEILKKISQKVKNGSSQNLKVNELKTGEQNIQIDNNNNSFLA